MTAEGEPAPGELAVGARARRARHRRASTCEKLDTIVDPLVVTDLATLVWSPHGHPEAVDALLHLAQVVLVDSVNEPRRRARRSSARRELAEDAYVVDLAWLRSTPWRERVAATFDPPQWRDELARDHSVTVRHQPESAAAGRAVLRLAVARGWDGSPGTLMAAHGGRCAGTRHGRRQDVDARRSSPTRRAVPGPGRAWRSRPPSGM